MKTKKIKVKMGESEVRRFKNNFNDFLEADKGFIIFFNGGTREVTHYYKDICEECIFSIVNLMAREANMRGLLSGSINHYAEIGRLRQKAMLIDKAEKKTICKCGLTDKAANSNKFKLGRRVSELKRHGGIR